MIDGMEDDASYLSEDEMERLLDSLDQILDERKAAAEEAGLGADGGGVDSVGDNDDDYGASDDNYDYDYDDDGDDGSLSDERMKKNGKGTGAKRDKGGPRSGRNGTVSDMSAKRVRRSAGTHDETQRNIASVLDGLRF